MMLERKIAVLVLGYNHRSTLEDVFQSVAVQTYGNYATFYIDNTSRDDSIKFVKANFPNVSVFQNQKNLGYAGAYAGILKKCFQEGYEGAVLLNPDTVVSPTWLEELVRSAFVADNIAFVQPKIYLWQNGPTNLFNTCGNQINFLGFGYCGCYKKKDEPPLLLDQDIAFASGASLFVKKSAYEALPGLDEDFFAYLEDQDLGWQAQVLGYRSVVSARSVMWHKYDFRKKHLDNFKFYLLERNRITYVLKYFERKTILLILPAFLIMEFGILGVSVAEGCLLEKIRGYFYNILHFNRTLRKRKAIQAIRLRKDKELFSLLSPDINFLDAQSFLLSGINAFLRRYYRIIRNLI